MLYVQPLSDIQPIPNNPPPLVIANSRNCMINSIALAILTGATLGFIVIKLKAKYRKSELHIPRDFLARKVFYIKTAFLDCIYPMEPVLNDENKIIYQYVSVKHWIDHPKRIFTSPLAKAVVTILTYELVKKLYSIYLRGIS